MEDGRVVKSAKQVAPASRLITKVSDGDVTSIVTADDRSA